MIPNNISSYVVCSGHGGQIQRVSTR